MRVLLQNVTREPEEGRIRVTLQVGDEPPKQFLGEYDGRDEKLALSIPEQELFVRLSDLASRRYRNCAIYQSELMGIIRAFLAGDPLPPFPIELGTTGFGMRRPTASKMFFARLKRPFYSAWVWWKQRKVKREE